MHMQRPEEEDVWCPALLFSPTPLSQSLSLNQELMVSGYSGNQQTLMGFLCACPQMCVAMQYLTWMLGIQMQVPMVAQEVL